MPEKGRGGGWRTAWLVLHPTGPHPYPLPCSSQQKPHGFSVPERLREEALCPCAGQSSRGRRDSQATAGEGKAKRDAFLAASPLCTQKASPEPLSPAHPASSLLPGHLLTTCSRPAWQGGPSCRAVGRGCISGPRGHPSPPPHQLTARQRTGVGTVTAPIFQVAEVKGHHLLWGGSSQSVLI